MSCNDVLCFDLFFFFFSSTFFCFDCWVFINWVNRIVNAFCIVVWVVLVFILGWMFWEEGWIFFNGFEDFCCGVDGFVCFLFVVKILVGRFILLSCCWVLEFILMFNIWIKLVILIFVLDCSRFSRIVNLLWFNCCLGFVFIKDKICIN